MNFSEKTPFLLRLVQDPARSKRPALTLSYEGSNSGYAIKQKKKTGKGQADTETWWNISQVSLFFLFISLKEKLDLTLFSVRRP